MPTAEASEWESLPMAEPRRAPGPHRVWPQEAWETISQGCVPFDQDHRWFAYVEDDVLHLHRSWTGFEIYRARFTPVDGGMSPVEIEVETHTDRYKAQSDAVEVVLFARIVDDLASGLLAGDGAVFDVVSSSASWRPRRDGDDRRRSAVALAEAILALGPEVTMSHRREFLSIAIWKYTESDGKETTRFRSQAAIGAPSKLCNHEHVFTRKSLIDEMLADPGRCRQIMERAVGCCVLRTEHQRLAAAERADPSLTGWDRYRSARIVVHDLLSGKPVT